MVLPCSKPLEDERIVDVVFLDENMPGLTGLETLAADQGAPSPLAVRDDHQE